MRASAAAARPSIAVRSAIVGQPPRNFAVTPGSYFSFPNLSTAAKYNIRNRVLNTVQSVWGGPRDSLHQPVAGNGTIRMATWSFNDWSMAKALVAARNRGVSVQIVGAATANVDHPSWQWLRRQLGAYRYVPGHPETMNSQSFARQCRGACRGHGGTPHSKFFLFDNVGAAHHRSVVMSTSMNLTTMAFNGQWNQAQVQWSSVVYNHFNQIFSQARIGVPVSGSYRRTTYGNVTDLFFPRPGTSASTDPVMQTLAQTRCAGATHGGSGSHTKIRIIQYAIYDTRGVWLAKKLRSLWNGGCDVAIIYAVSSRPVLQILRNGSGRGPIPMRQSVYVNNRHEIVKYNHSKWMTITGNWGGSRAAYVTFNGSANWSNSAFNNDEQMQQITSQGVALSHLSNFSTTWRQRSSHAPGYGSSAAEGRMLPPGDQVAWGSGMYKYLSPNG